MDLRRLRAGDWILAVSGAALLFSLFLPWYSLPGEESWTAWEAFAAIDIALLGCGAVALAAPVVTATQKTVAVPIALTSIATILCAVAAVLAIVRIVFEPAVSTGIAEGAWLGAAAALTMTVGAWIAVRDERLSRPGRPTDTTGRPAPPPPPVETVSPPRPSG